MASRRNGTLFTGVTNNLALRAHQHRTGVGSTFTTKYGVKMLVWYEQYGEVNEAIAREKQLKAWERKWKLANRLAFCVRCDLSKVPDFQGETPGAVWLNYAAARTERGNSVPCL